MKRVTSLLIALFIIATVLAGCGSRSDKIWNGENTEKTTNGETVSNATEPKETEPEEAITIKTSPDKYTWYIKNYVGKNCASIGYTSMGGDRMDHYGAGYIRLVLVTPDGNYVDIETDDDLKQYVVTGQSIAPNTELKFTFEKDDDGNEYENLVATQNYEEIVLCVKRVGSSEETSLGLTAINPSPDKYTWYIRDYVGKNCASIGYTSMGGDRMEHYGAGYIELVLVTPDGSYIDIETDNDLKQYVVTGQSLAPNTELKFTFEKDDDGNEYENLVATQNCKEIVLCVKRVGSSEETTLGLTAINPSPDKYTWYIRDYTGRNLASCGYLSMGGNRMDHYGAGYIKFVIVSDDGTYIDPKDTELLKSYVITGQSIAPNTELKYVFATDSKGIEYENLVSSQNIEEIELTVKPIDKES